MIKISFKEDMLGQNDDFEMESDCKNGLELLKQLAFTFASTIIYTQQTFDKLNGKNSMNVKKALLELTGELVKVIDPKNDIETVTDEVEGHVDTTGLFNDLLRDGAFSPIIEEMKKLLLNIEACGYTCQAGPLENNIAYAKLRKLVFAGLKEDEAQ